MIVLDHVDKYFLAVAGQVGPFQSRLVAKPTHSTVQFHTPLKNLRRSQPYGRFTGYIRGTRLPLCLILQAVKPIAAWMLGGHAAHAPRPFCRLA